jgi:hypothetical protein
VSLERQVGTSSNTYRFSKAMIYKMITQLADFDEKYRGLVAITLDNDAMEAAGTVSFAGIPVKGNFHSSPAYLDALSQLGGFVMNANEGVDLEKEVFVNHGWKSMRFLKELDPKMTYSSHVVMREGSDKLWEGDVLIFDSTKAVVGIVGGVQLQGVPKRLMHYIVTAANKKVSGDAAHAKTAQKSDHQTSAKPISPTQSAPISAKTTKTTKRVAAVVPIPTESKSLAPALKIVSEELGVETDQLTDDLVFADAGLDSLLSLVGE